VIIVNQFALPLAPPARTPTCHVITIRVFTQEESARRHFHSGMGAVQSRAEVL
jgi:hypothetical protein